jgi:phosphatidylcholine synthase
MTKNKIFAWCAHAYTALGLVAAAFSIVFIFMGGDENLRYAIIMLFIAIVIDASDGYFARLARVKEVLPYFDGRRLDDIIDFHTYTTIPLLLIWRSDLLPGNAALILLIPLLASAYGFSQTNAKTGDGYFLGFPSYWNVIAVYLFLLRPGTWVSVSVIVLFSVLTFVPAKYLHPSLPGPLSKFSVLFGAVWALLMFTIIIGITDGYSWVIVSLAYPLYYVTASWIITVRDFKST